MEWCNRTILLAVAIAVMPLGCKKASRPAEGQETSSGPGRLECTWPAPCPTAPPPPAWGPEIPPGKAPTEHTDARIGMKVVLRLTLENAPDSLQTNEVVDIDQARLYVRQTTRSKTGEFACRLVYNRFRDPAPRAAGPQPESKAPAGKLVTTAGGALLCEIHEETRSGHVYRTLRSRDVLGGTVRHGDNAAGKWKTRLELVDWRD